MRRTRQLLIIPVLCCVLAVTLVTAAGCSIPKSSPAPASSQSGSSADLTPSRDILSASGAVLPARRATLSMSAAGRITALKVRVGDRVEAGRILLQLETGALQAAVDSARANLVAAQADLDRLNAGARPQQIAAAEAAVAAADAGLAQAKAGLSGAEAAYQGAIQGQKNAELGVAIARAGVSAATAARAKVKAGPGSEIIAAAKAQMQKADALRGQAQGEYDKIAYAGGAGASPQAAALQQATADYESAKASYDALRAQPRPEDLAMADAEVTRAQTQLDAAQGAIPTAKAAADGAAAARDGSKAAVEAAVAVVMRLKAELDLLKAGAPAAELAGAKARVLAAQAAVAGADAALAQATLRAPFAGAVSELLVREGESITPGVPLVELGDLTHLRVETTDLNEIDLYRLQIGQSVQVTFDALPGRKIAGKVAEMAMKATRAQAGTNYTVIVELEEQDPQLRWGMTAFIDAVKE